LKVIHSFWSKAYFRGRWGEEPKLPFDLYCFALSSHFANKTFGSIELVTDEAGAFLLEGLPYADIHLGLEDISHVDSRMWTAGKVKALDSFDQDVLHIDGDVFFLEKSVNAVMNSSWDSIVQSREIGAHYQSTYPPILYALNRLHPESHKLSLYNFTYNTGIFGFKNQEFKKLYAKEYFKLVEELTIKGVEYPPKHDPNVVVEQSLFTQMSQDHNMHVKELITINQMDSDGLFDAAEEMGYVHLWGNSKYQQQWHEKVKQRLKEENPKLFDYVTHRINTI